MVGDDTDELRDKWQNIPEDTDDKKSLNDMKNTNPTGFMVGDDL